METMPAEEGPLGGYCSHCSLDVLSESVRIADVVGEKCVVSSKI